MSDKDKEKEKEEILRDIKNGDYIDRDDVKDEVRKEKARRDANGGWSS